MLRAVRHLSRGLALMCLGAGCAHAAGSTLTLRLVPTPDVAIQAKLLRRLAEVGKPVLVKVPSGATLDDLIRQRCGFVNESVRSALTDANPGGAIETEGERRLLFPPCPFWSFDVPLPVEANTNMARALHIATGFFGPKTQKQLLQKNPTALNNRPQVVTLPHVSKPFTILLKEGVGSPEQVAYQLSLEFPKLLPAEFRTSYAAGATTIALYTAVPASAVTNCTGRPDKWPFDAERVALALETNKFLRNPHGQYVRAAILVADTGLREADAAQFPLRRNPEEGGINSRVNQDDDFNGFVDDVVGANMSGRAGFPEPISAYPEADHGTQVASQIFGPWMNDRLRALVRERVSISAANVVHNDVIGINEDGAPRIHVHVPLSAIERSFGYAERMTPWPVLNVSFKSDVPLPSLEIFLKGAPYLTVVAAGNDGEPIEKVGKSRYPAEWRRHYKEALITVAAHDGAGRLARFSNRGRPVVDLAAPGCMLPVQTFDGTKTSSGTSLAAPLVSLTAALLYSEGLFRPAQIRNRVLSTTDFDPALSDTYSSGRLNMEKALRIYQDIVQMQTNDGSVAVPLFGKLTAEGDLRICGDAVPLRDIVKLIPRYRAGESPLLLIRKSAGGFAQSYCAAPTGVTVWFTPEGTNSAGPIALERIAELIPALR